MTMSSVVARRVSAGVSSARRRETERAQMRAYYVRNRDRQIAYAKTWTEQNRARHNEYSRRWRHRNPDTVRMLGALRRNRLRASVGTCTPSQFAARWEYYGGRCWMCGIEADSVDHVIPVSVRPLGWPSNLRPSCRPCNSRKGNR